MRVVRYEVTLVVPDEVTVEELSKQVALIVTEEAQEVFQVPDAIGIWRLIEARDVEYKDAPDFGDGKDEEKVDKLRAAWYARAEEEAGQKVG
jgi:hypothetical protein